MSKNDIIKKTARSKGVKLWEVAERLGIADTSLSRKLRRDLSPAETEMILEIIDELSAPGRQSRFALIRGMSMEALAEYLAQDLGEGIPINWHEWLAEEVLIDG